MTVDMTVDTAAPLGASGPLPAPRSARFGGSTAADQRRPAWAVVRRMGTAARLAALYSVILVAVLGGSLIALLHTTSVGMEQIAVRQLGAELVSFQQAAAARPSNQPLRTFATAYLHSHAVADGDLLEISLPGSWAVANAGGSAVADNPGIESLASSIPHRSQIRSRQVADRQLEVLTAPILTGSRTSGLFLAAVDTTPLKPAGDTAARLAILVGAVALVAGVASAYLVLRRLLRRIGRIADTADRIGQDRIDARLGDQGTTDEVGQLAHSFDSMLDRIERAVNAQHELLSDVSHQLRTPLTVARGHLELLGRTGGGDAEVAATVDTAIGELDRMARLVDRLLILGRAREPVRYDMQDVDLRAFVGDLLRAGTVLAPRQWEIGTVPDAVIRVDESEVRGAVLNLLDNAIHATAAGDTIRLSARLLDGEVILTVEDSGPGIPPAERTRVLDRFARRPAIGTDGSGLGLAIVSAVCEAHGGAVTIGESGLGGAAVSMRLQPQTAVTQQPSPEPVP
ncbi:MAG TPA: HAMP domain-containing sensor histidine kinase [Acidimicrobiales bacterium]|nr:HAMP domain-containing sensor histidine kinase [Acidimicrobiales bacterium]